jgi:argininosuccinate lyase
MAQPLWAGRLSGRPTDAALAFQSSFPVDQRMLLEDLAGSRAHARMLGKQGIIPQAEADALIREIEAIIGEAEAGTLPIPGYGPDLPEDVHSFVEQLLTERLGDAGKRLHTARSRNDQVALDARLYVRARLRIIRGLLVDLIGVLARIGRSRSADPMPGYTHLQRAQPVTLGFHLAAWCAMLMRDHGRLSDALARLSDCPLGSGALAGTTFPIDRGMTARELGFERPSLNAMDSVADRDFFSEAGAAAAILMVHLSRFCEEVVIWSSGEFGFIELSDEWSTGSSIMPQKKNPDYAELIRGKSARVIGDLLALLSMQKGLPLSYNKDIQEDKEALFDALDTVEACLSMFAPMLGSARFRTDRMREAALKGFTNATDFADYLVRAGLPFRDAHAAAAKAVRDCLDRGIALADLKIEDFKAYSESIGQDVYQAIALEACLERRSAPGGTAPAAVLSQFAEIDAFVSRSLKTEPQGG